FGPRPPRSSIRCRGHPRRPLHFLSAFLEGSFQSRTVPYRLPDARSLPLGLNVTEVTLSSCPLRAAVGLREFTSHSLTVFSSLLPEASGLPSRLNATESPDPKTNPPPGGALPTPSARRTGHGLGPPGQPHRR